MKNTTYNRRSILKLVGSTGAAVSMGTMSTGATSDDDFDEYDYLDRVVNNGTGTFELDPGTTVKDGGLTQSVYLLNKDTRVGAPPQFEIGVVVHGEAPDLYHHQDGIRSQGTTVRVRNADVWAPNSTGSVGVFPETEDASSTELGADLAVTMLTTAFEEVGTINNPVSAAINIGYNVMNSSTGSVNELDSEFTLGFNHNDSEVGNVRYGHLFRFPIQPHSYDSRVSLQILSKSSHTSQQSNVSVSRVDADC